MEQFAIIADVNSLVDRSDLLNEDLYIPQSVLDFLNRHQSLSVYQKIIEKINLEKVIKLPKQPNSFADFDEYEAYFVLSVMKFKVKNNVQVATRNTKIRRFFAEHNVNCI